MISNSTFLFPIIRSISCDWCVEKRDFRYFSPLYRKQLQAALDRVSRLRNSGLVSQNIPIVAIENFVVETEANQWFDMGCVLIDDPVKSVCVHVLTQGTPLPTAVIDVLKVCSATVT
jgi:hypothetical protein